MAFLPRVLVAAALAFCAAASVGSVENVDRDNGLPNAHLGAPIDAFKGIQLVEDTGRWLTYKDQGDKIKYAGYGVSGIEYNFFKGKLYSIFVNVEGPRSTGGILKVLERAYGQPPSVEKKLYTLDKTKPKAPKAEVEIREWTGAKVYVLYKSAADGAGAQLTFLDKPAWDLLQVPRQEKAAAARAMLGGSFANGDF